jgi:DNA-binding transcriptional MerR regulator
MVQGEFFDVSHAKPEDELPDMAAQPERSRRGLKDFTIPKLYRSISEVSALAGIEQYVLRYWETEFSELRPHKNRAGNRVYSEKDIRVVNRIKELLRDERYTIEGAKQILKQELESERKAQLADIKPTEDDDQLPIIPLPKPTEITVQISELHEIKKSLLILRERLALTK